MISDATRAEIRRLFYAEHWKVGTIAEQLSLHHETVRRALGTDHFATRSRVRPSALDPYVAFIRDTFERYPRLTATRVHEMIRQRGYEGSVGQLRRRVRQLDLRPKPTSEAFFRVRRIPGEQGQVDWAHLGRLRVGRCERPLYGFVVVLAWSRAVHVEFGFEQNAAAVARGHIAAFKAFGGVPRQMLYDNMKTVVIERVGAAFRFHDRLLELAAHYHFAPHVCHPGRPNEKPSVERRIRDLRTSLLAGRSFGSLDELRRAFAQWRDEVAHARPCPARKELTVAEALEEERGRLLALPQHHLDGDDVHATVARKQPYVRYDTCLYSIPHELVGQPLTLAATHLRVRVMHHGEVVADHERCWERDSVIEHAPHLDGLAEVKRRGAVARGRTRLLDAVPEAEALYAELAARNEPMRPQTAALTRLLDRYGAQRLRQGIQQALQRGTPLASSVGQLLSLADRASGRPPRMALQLPDELSALDTITHDLGGYDEL